MDMAEKMYAKDHQDKDFHLKHFWKVVGMKESGLLMLKEKWKRKRSMHPIS